MDVNEGYKLTEVGVVPEDWDICKVGDVCKLINGRGFKPFEWSASGLPIIRIQNLNGSQDFNYYDGEYLSKLEVEDGQLLFAWSGSRGTSFGPHIWKGSVGLLNYHTWKVQIYEAIIHPEFYFYCLKELTKEIEDSAHGASALVHTQKWEMETYEFPMPGTRIEQQAIAEALSDADALIDSLEQLIVKKQLIKQGAMQELLTGKRRLPGFDGEWRRVPIGALLEVCHGRGQSAVERSSGDIPILATGGQIGWSCEALYERPSVLIGRKGTIDCPQYMDSPFWTVDTLFYTKVVEPNNAKYLFYQFCLIPWKKYNEASGVPSLNASTIEAIEISAPAPEEQSAIAQTLTDIDTEITALESRLTKARQIKQGMMQELLTGRIRLMKPVTQTA